LSSNYELVHSVDAGNGLNADLHEFLLTPDGTALMTVYGKYRHDLSDWRSFNATTDPNDADPGWIWDCVLQEIAVDTRDVIFEWRASEHININDTYHLLRHAGNHEDPFDWFHMNSIRKDEFGNYLVSARYTHSITYIDGKTGGVIWILGGKRNVFMDLSDGFAINFAWQHDAQFVSAESFPETYNPPVEQLGYTTRLLSLFDNAAEDQNYTYGTDHSRGLLLEVTFPTPGYQSVNNAKASNYTRDISHLQKLAVESRHQLNKTSLKIRPNLPYPKYGQDKLQDPDANRLKISRINSSNPSHTVRVIKTYSNPSGVRSSSQGSMQILPPAIVPNSNDNINASKEEARVFVGYGLNAVFTVFSADSSVLCDAHFGAVTSWERGDIQSYRAYKFSWVGKPSHPPRMTIKLSEGNEDEEEQSGERRRQNLTAYVSWNGATEVATYILQQQQQQPSEPSNTPIATNNAKTPWTELTRSPKTGFETTLSLPSSFSTDLSDLTSKNTTFRILAFSKTGQLLPNGITEPFNATDIILPPPPPPAISPDPQVETEGTPQSTRIPEPENSIETSSATSMRIFLGASLVMLAALTVYKLYRRYLCWKSGRGSGGAVRWRVHFGWWLGRKKGGYRLVSSSSTSSSTSSMTSFSSSSGDGASWSGRSVSGESSSSSGSSGAESWVGDV
jgi:hypothetical protein